MSARYALGENVRIVTTLAYNEGDPPTARWRVQRRGRWSRWRSFAPETRGVRPVIHWQAVKVEGTDDASRCVAEYHVDVALPMCNRRLVLVQIETVAGKSATAIRPIRDFDPVTGKRRHTSYRIDQVDTAPDGRRERVSAATGQWQ